MNARRQAVRGEVIRLRRLLDAKAPSERRLVDPARIAALARGFVQSKEVSNA